MSNIIETPEEFRTEVFGIENSQTQFCPYCGTMIDSTFTFCPHCGKTLEILHGVGIGKQMYIYFMSIFMPPAGIIYGMRYAKSTNSQVRTVGYVATILTLVSLVITIWLILDIGKQFQDAVSKYSTLGM